MFKLKLRSVNGSMSTDGFYLLYPQAEIRFGANIASISQSEIGNTTENLFLLYAEQTQQVCFRKS